MWSKRSTNQCSPTIQRHAPDPSNSEAKRGARGAVPPAISAGELSSNLRLFTGARICSGLAAGHCETFNAMPGGNGLSPTLKAVLICDISQEETFSFEIPSFLLASKISAVGGLIRYLTLLPSF